MLPTPSKQMTLRQFLFFLLIALPVLATAQQAITESGPLPPPDLSLTRASTILHDDDSKTVTLYDSEKKQSDVKYYNPNGTWRAHILYTLGDDGKIKAGQFFNRAGKPTVRSRYRYDDSERVTEENHYDQTGKLIRRMTYEYGFSDRVMKTVAYDSQGNVLGVYIPKKSKRSATTNTASTVNSTSEIDAPKPKFRQRR